MKIDKAIELLSASANDGMTPFNEDFQDAIELGIEALKLIKSFRTNMGSQRFWQLPGETEK